MLLPANTICDHCHRQLEISDENRFRSTANCPHCFNPVRTAPENSGVLVNKLPSDDPSPSAITTRLESMIPGNKTASRGFPSRSPRAEEEGEVRQRHPVQIGRFLITAWLGSGAHGDVFRAWDEENDHEVALKVLRRKNMNDKTLRRFENEAIAAGKCDHNGVVRLYDKGRDSGHVWISYELIRGRSLAEELRKRRFTHRQSADIVLRVANALYYVHRMQITHRDVKPANILLDDQQNPKLTDLGLARFRGHDVRMSTMGGYVVGTRYYMSPEQAVGRSHIVDGRTDIYSLGIIFCELLIGRLPIAEDDEEYQETSNGHTSLEPRAFDPSIPNQLNKICMRATALDYKERYQTMEAFALEITRWLRSTKPSNECTANPINRLGSTVLKAAKCLVLPWK